ncbi:MAG: heavy metal translocating P-type ATPase [Noviherbaspirillum sp.]
MSAALAVPAQAGSGSEPARRQAAASCFHCGSELPADAHWTVEIDGAARPMCCPGCAAVAQAIAGNGFTDYYRTRSDYAGSASLADAATGQLLLYDSPDAMARFARAGEGDACVATFSVEGIRCASCVWLIERRLARVPGVESASLNVATERVQVRWSAARCKPSDILLGLREIGYAAYPFDPARQEAGLRRAARTLGRQLFVAGLCMMQVMMYAWPSYFHTDVEPDMQALLRWASLLLTVPAVCYSALPFFRGAWHSLKSRAPGMDVPVALGIAVAFTGSAVATWRGAGEVYFDSVTMFVFLLLCSRYLELVARRKAASALERMQHGLPDSAQRLPGYPASRAAETVGAAQLAVGDVILVKPGEALAADGVVLEGESALDLSLLSGESRPQPIGPGDAAPGGAVNAGQPLLLRVEKAARDSTLAALVQMAERAGQAKPLLSQWADRVAAWFVSALLLFALAVFVFWQWHDPARAWLITVAVLAVSCPCALSLATPSALAAATDRLLRMGVLVVQPHVLETLHRATHVVFDKTGTLTLGRPALEAVHAYGAASRDWCLGAAAALEAGSGHPLAAALRDAAAGRGAAPALMARDARHAAGRGVEGEIGGTRYRLGSVSWVAELAGPDCPRPAQGSSTQVWLGTQGAWLACFELADALREDAQEVVRRFQAAGKQVVLLSGDQEAVARRVADGLGIADAHGNCLPAQKLAFVQQLQQQGAVVAMVGDGINDAAVLGAADVSFAMGSGAALAQSHADTVLLSPRLMAVWQTAAMAARTMAVVRQNLYWATVYNAVAIPAAAAGWISPWLCGVGMAASSALVVGNALRLRRLPRRAAPMQTSTP